MGSCTGRVRVFTVGLVGVCWKRGGAVPVSPAKTRDRACSSERDPATRVRFCLVPPLRRWDMSPVNGRRLGYVRGAAGRGMSRTVLRSERGARRGDRGPPVPAHRVRQRPERRHDGCECLGRRTEKGLRRGLQGLVHAINKGRRAPYEETAAYGYFSLPRHLSFAYYHQAFTDSGMSGHFLHSLLIAVPGVLLTLFLASFPGLLSWPSPPARCPPPRALCNSSGGTTASRGAWSSVPAAKNSPSLHRRTDPRREQGVADRPRGTRRRPHGGPPSYAVTPDRWRPGNSVCG